MPISNAVLREILSPEGALVRQSPELSAALRHFDSTVLGDVIAAQVGDVSPDASRALEGLVAYWAHMHAVVTHDNELAEATHRQAAQKFGNMLNDIRRTGSVLRGIAYGKLNPAGYEEARDLVHSVFGADSSDAAEILGRISRVKLSLRAWLRLKLNDFHQDMYLRSKGKKPVVKLPSRATEGESRS